MGAQGSTEAKQGVGNVRSVEGDNVIGQKSTQHNLTKNSSRWTHADTFEDSFNHYYVQSNEGVQVHGDGNTVLQHVTIGGNMFVIHGNGNFQPVVDPPSVAADPPAAPEVVCVRVAAVTSDSQHAFRQTSNFIFRMQQMTRRAVNFPASIRMDFGDLTRVVHIESSIMVANNVELTCTVGAPVGACTVYGEACTATSAILFSGQIIPLDQIDQQHVGTQEHPKRNDIAALIRSHCHGFMDFCQRNPRDTMKVVLGNPVDMAHLLARNPHDLHHLMEENPHDFSCSKDRHPSDTHQLISRGNLGGFVQTNPFDTRDFLAQNPIDTLEFLKMNPHDASEFFAKNPSDTQNKLVKINPSDWEIFTLTVLIRRRCHDFMDFCQRNPWDTLKVVWANPVDMAELLAQNPHDLRHLMEENPCDFASLKDKNPSDRHKFVDRGDLSGFVRANPYDTRDFLAQNPTDTCKFLQKNPYDASEFFAKNPFDTQGKLVKANPRDWMHCFGGH